VHAGDSGLTPKEREILDLVAQGLSNQKIAKRLWLSPETVKTYLSNTYRTLNGGNRTQAAKKPGPGVCDWWPQQWAASDRGRELGRRLRRGGGPRSADVVRWRLRWRRRGLASGRF
jgi:DNA-binding CsgD family transcriptional regulator